MQLESPTQTSSSESDSESEVVVPTKNQEQEAESIKKAADEFMYFNFAKVGKTTWYDSITSSGARITDNERVYAVQYSDEDQFENAKKYIGSLNMFFSSKTNKTFHVDKIVLYDKEMTQKYEMETIKW
ncbi:MAG: hypothetical protein ACQET8_12575 [Bacillota bacterium]